MKRSLLLAMMLITLPVHMSEMTNQERESAFSAQQHVQTSQGIISGTLYDVFLMPNSSRNYMIDVAENNILWILLENGTRDSVIELDMIGEVNRTKLDVLDDRGFHVYYIAKSGEWNISFRNPGPCPIYFRFYVDISQNLLDSQLLSMPFGGTQKSFYIELKRDDVLVLNMEGPDPGHLCAQIFVLCYEIALGGTSYVLCRMEESYEDSLSFKADMTGRYYIVLGKVREEEPSSLKYSIISPPWNQEYFWPSIGVISASVACFFFMRIMRQNRLKEAEKGMFSCHFLWLLNAVFFASIIGAYNYVVFIHRIMFYSFVLFFVSSLALQMHFTFLERKDTRGICPYCFREVNTSEVNHCCGHVVKKITFFWFLVPVAFGFTFFVAGHLVLRTIDSPSNLDLLIGSSGSIVGGTIAWWLNRSVHGAKAWKFLAAGTLLAFIMPFLIGFLTEISFQPHVQLEWPGRLIRIRLAPLNLSPGISLVSIVLSMCLISSIVANMIKIAGKRRNEID